jgi:hypothetical protein
MSDASYHAKAYVCLHIFDGSRPVLLVVRSASDWSFLCGAEHEDTGASYRVVGKGHILDRDPTLKELADLAPNWEAERASVRDAWVRKPCGEPV